MTERWRVDDVELVSERRWWGPERKLTSTSAFPMPERVTLFVSVRGMEYAYWRDLLVGEPGFDASHFIYCDVPALLPLIVGEATRKSLEDRPSLREALTLHVRGGVVTVEGLTTDKAAVARHLAVHRALVTDYRACLAGWQQRMSDALGRGDAVWPLTGTVMCRAGSLGISVSWSRPTSRDDGWDEASQTVFTHVLGTDDRGRDRWSVRAVADTEPATHVLGDRRFAIRGAPPMRLALLEPLIQRGEVVLIAGGGRVEVVFRGMPTATRLPSAVRIVELGVDATSSTSPYR